MPIHQKSPSQEQFSTRLLALELHRTKGGLARYVRRAVDLARDVEPNGSHTAAAILALKRQLFLTFDILESRIRHD